MIWLLKAHADSSILESILLATTILKLAIYRYLRVLIHFLLDVTHYFSPVVQTMAIIILIYTLFSTIIQPDTKRLIVYSFICHMAVVLLELFSNTIISIENGILLLLAHGFVSLAIFICIGSVIYNKMDTRIINHIRGFATYMPVFIILFLIFTLPNTSILLILN